MREKKQKKPPIPAERNETVRQQITTVLKGDKLSAKDISVEVRISEKEVYEHLYHIQISMNKIGDSSFVVTPARCKKCGFIFKKRDRLKKPGKCPICNAEAITEPLFFID